MKFTSKLQNKLDHAASKEEVKGIIDETIKGAETAGILLDDTDLEEASGGSLAGLAGNAALAGKAGLAGNGSLAGLAGNAALASNGALAGNAGLAGKGSNGALAGNAGLANNSSHANKSGGSMHNNVGRMNLR